MIKNFILLSHKFIADSKIVASTTYVGKKKPDIYIISVAAFVIPNDILIEGINYINEINEGLTYLNHLYINITNTMGNLGSNFFLSNSNMV